MALGPKWLGVTLPLAAFLGSAAGVMATQKFLAGPLALPVLAVATPAPAPVPLPSPEMPPVPSRVIPSDNEPATHQRPPRPGQAPFGVTKVEANEPPMPPVPDPGRSPFPASDQPPPPTSPAPPAKPAADADDQPEPMDAELESMTKEIPLPPGFFELAAPNKGDGTDPPILKPGQYLQVEVLEALPGRPLSGRRVIRPDGTISLGFYGDLRAAGLNRDQVKVKLIERMNKHLTHTTLGIETLRDGKRVLIPALETNRIFIDDSLNYESPAGSSP